MAGDPRFPMPKGSPAFTAPWFKWFFPLLTLPEGNPVRWEGHLLLMTDVFFEPQVQHLLVIIGKGNWKTTWEGGLGVWHLVTVPAPRIYCGAENVEQAKELYGFARHFSQCMPSLARMIDVRSSTRELRFRGNEADVLKVLAGDDSRDGGKKQGKNTTLGLADEPHAYENDNLWVDLTSGGFKRREAARLAGDPLWWVVGKDASITTAGHDVNGPLGRERAKFLGDPKRGVPPLGTVETGLRVLEDGSVEKHPDGRLTICRSKSGASVMLEWANREDDDRDDMHVVKFANPASTKTLEALADARERLTDSQFDRYHRCVWTVGDDSWLPERAWPALRDDSVPVVPSRTWEGDSWNGARDDAGLPQVTSGDSLDGIEATPEFEAFVRSLFPRGERIVAALDMARYRDTAALVAVAVRDDGRKVPRAIVWRSGGEEHPIRYEDVEVAVLLLQRMCRLEAFAADPKYADQMLGRMQVYGVAAEAFPQSNERIGKADTDLRRAILAGEFAHDGDPILTAHVQAAASKDLGESLLKTIKQPIRSAPPIDACKALSMANALLAGPVEVQERSMYEDPEVGI